MFQEPTCDGMTSFMVSYSLSLFISHDSLLLETSDNSLCGFLKLFHADNLKVSSGSDDSCLVANISDVCTTETRSEG